MVQARFAKQANSRSHGFALVEVIAGISVILLVGGAGWLVYHKHTTTKQPPFMATNAKSAVQNTRTNRLSSPDGVFSVQLPSDWSNAGHTICGPLIDPVQCIAEFPVTRTDGNANFTIFEEVSTGAEQSAQSWAYDTIAAPASDTKSQTSGSRINGYEAFYIQDSNPSSEDEIYTIVHGKDIVQIEYSYGHPDDFNQASSYNSYAAQVADVANSIVFK